jgi:hypothetical protein
MFWGALVLAVSACREFTGAKAPLFLVSPGALAFTARAGGQHPPLQFLSINQTDGQPVRWSASADVLWIRLLSRGDTMPYFLGVEAGTELTAGVYRGTLAVARPSTGDVRLVPITLTLLSTTPLAGRWAGLQDSVSVTLTLAESGGQVSGVGSLGPPERSVQVTGTYTYPTVSLRLAASSDTTNLTGTFVDDNSIAATLNGPRLANVATTIYRQ